MICPICGFIPAGMGNPFGCWGHATEDATKALPHPLWITKWDWSIQTNPRLLKYDLNWPETKESFERLFPHGWLGVDERDIPSRGWYDPVRCCISYKLFEHRFTNPEIQKARFSLTVQDLNGDLWLYSKTETWRRVI